jgi:hypothetical protein
VFLFNFVFLVVSIILFMGGHEISIKWIFYFRTSLPINEISYIQYINGKRKKSPRIKSHKTSRKKSHRKNVTIYFFHIYYTPESHSMYNEWLCPYPGYGVYRHFQNLFGDMVSSIEAPSTSHLRWCSEVVPEVIVCAGATGSCITGYDVTGNDVTGSREPEMKGRSFPAVFPELL